MALSLERIVLPYVMHCDFAGAPDTSDYGRAWTCFEEARRERDAMLPKRAYPRGIAARMRGPLNLCLHWLSQAYKNGEVETLQGLPGTFELAMIDDKQALNVFRDIKERYFPNF